MVAINLMYCQARVQVQGLSQISKRPGPGACSYIISPPTHPSLPENFSEQNKIEFPAYVMYCQARVQVQGLSQISKGPGPGA